MATHASNEEVEALRRRVVELEARLEALPGELMSAWASDLQRVHEQVVGHLRLSVAELERRVGSSATTGGSGDERVTDGGLDEELYAALEERFRGSEAEITERQRSYLGDIASTPAGRPVLDLGCGRGEFLRLLVDAGIRAEGVDSSEQACRHCREEGLAATHGDLLDVLRGTPDRSRRAITMLQVAEHLELAVLFEVLRQAVRVLVSGGLLIVETPNAANVTVAASTFWLDPTHVRPLHPLLLQFLAEQAGFDRTELRASSPASPAWQLPEGPGAPVEPGAVVEALRGVQDLLVGPQDLTLLAHVAD